MLERPGECASPALHPVLAPESLDGRNRHIRITKLAVDRLGPGQILRDTDLKGFGVRRQKGGPIYFLQKRINRRVRWLTIGAHGAPWTAETARREAFRLLGEVTSGSDPQLRRRDLRARPTLAEASERLLALHGKRLKPLSYEKYAHLLRRHIGPALGDKLLDEIVRRDVLRLHTAMAAHPRLANYAVAVLSKLMSWAEEEAMRPEQSNPCLKIKKYRENKRQRYLSSAEFRRLGEALERTERLNSENLYIVAAIRLLLFTGTRLGEILTLEWSSVDLERRLLLLPDSKTGQKVIRLHAAVILAQVPRAEGNLFVIAGRKTGSPLINLQKPWRRIRAEAGLDDVRLHDLRHSFASVAAASKGSLPMIGRLLGHTHTTTARYAHLAADPIDELNENVGDHIAAAIGMPSRSQPGTGG